MPYSQATMDIGNTRCKYNIKENFSSRFNNSEYSTGKTQDGGEAAGEKCD